MVTNLLLSSIALNTYTVGGIGLLLKKYLKVKTRRYYYHHGYYEALLLMISFFKVTNRNWNNKTSTHTNTHTHTHTYTHPSRAHTRTHAHTYTRFIKPVETIIDEYSYISSCNLCRCPFGILFYI